MNQEQKDEFLTPRNSVRAPYPMHLWKSDTGNQAAQDQARKAFMADVDRAFDSVEGDLISNGGVRRIFMKAPTSNSVTLTEAVSPTLRNWVRKNGAILSPAVMTALTTKLIGSLWELWRDESPEQK